MAEVYCVGNKINVLYQGQLVSGILEGISNLRVNRGISLMGEDGLSQFYPISELEGLEIKPLKLVGMTDLCVHVDEELTRRAA